MLLNLSNSNIHQMKKVIVLCSGGMDSVTALHHIAAHNDYQVVGVASFDYNSKHNPKELPFAALHADKLKLPHYTLPLGFIGHYFKSHLLMSGGTIPPGHYEADVMKQTVVPFRNGIMLSIAAGLAESLEADGVVIAAHAGDHAIYPDCREDFMINMAGAIHKGTYRQIELIRPFIHMSKADIVKRAAELSVDLRESWSCYVGGPLHCGRCGTCIERREAFYLAGIPDPTEYAADAPSLELLVKNNFKLTYENQT